MSETGGSLAARDQLQHQISKSKRIKSLISEETDSVSGDMTSVSTEGDEETGVVTFTDLVFSPPFMMAAMAASVSQFIYSYMEPILAKRLEDLDLSQV